MRKMCILTTSALILVATTAHAVVSVGVSGFGGISIPIVNDLSKQGGVYGARVPVRIVPGITVEPFYSMSSLGNVEETFGGTTTYTRDGGEVTGFGGNLLFTLSEGTTNFFPFGGIGSYEIKRDGAEDVTEVGYNFGLGLNFAPPSWSGLSFDVRGELLMIKTDETSQKFGNITAGVSYKLFSGTTP